MTVIVVAHRISTIIDMDRILVLDQGEIIEQGSPQSLSERDGVFASLARLEN